MERLRLCLKNNEDQSSQSLDGWFKPNISRAIDTHHKQTGNSVYNGNKCMIHYKAENTKMNKIVPKNIYIFIISLSLHSFDVFHSKKKRKRKTLKKICLRFCSLKICKLSYVCIKIVIIMDLVSPVKINIVSLIQRANM